MASKAKGGRRRGAAEHGRVSSPSLPNSVAIGNKNSGPANLPVEENIQVTDDMLPDLLFQSLAKYKEKKEKNPHSYSSSNFTLPLPSL